MARKFQPPLTDHSYQSALPHLVVESISLNLALPLEQEIFKDQDSSYAETSYSACSQGWHLQLCSPVLSGRSQWIQSFFKYVNKFNHMTGQSCMPSHPISLMTLHRSALIYNILTSWRNSRKAIFTPYAFQVLEKTLRQPPIPGINLHQDPCPGCITGLLKESDVMRAGIVPSSG